MGNIKIEGLNFAELRRLIGRRMGRKKPGIGEQRPKAALIPSLYLATTTHRSLMAELTSHEPEMAGVLIGPVGHRCITHFVLDESGRSSAGAFTFDHVRLNEILKKYLALGLEARGFAHSHPSGYTRLSEGDLVYVRKVLLNPKNTVSEVFMPIVVDGKLYPFVVLASHPDRAFPCELTLF